jgi:antirestriction protein ArdC
MIKDIHWKEGEIVDVYQIITDQILKEMEGGSIPWHKPWTAAALPKNFKSGKTYRGFNLWYLATRGYKCPYWATFKQINEKGGRVKKGEKSTMVVFWKVDTVQKYDEERNETKEKRRFILRYYRVFNLEQQEGIEIPKVEQRDFIPIEKAEQILNEFKNACRIEHSADLLTGDSAFYSPVEDFISLPLKENFHSEEEYYSVRFHETVHSTGHEKRLNREGVADRHSFGDTEYSKEELIAESGAAMLCGICGIANKTLKNSVAYIQNWIKALKNNRKWLVCAFANAQRAADYIQNIKKDYAKK